MRKLLCVLLIIAILAAVSGICWWEFGPGSRHLQGRTEREWIASLAARPGDKEMQQWRALGPDAVPVLSRALAQGTSPFKKWYLRNWYHFPSNVRKRLGTPRDPVFVRRNSAWVLAQLNCDINAAAPALGRALLDDDQEVRVNAAKCLEALLPSLGPDKARLVPDLVRAIHDTNEVVRENVTKCLGDCPEQSRAAIPALVSALGDPVRMNRYFAVLSLKRMKLQDADKGKVEPMLLDCLGSSDLVVSLNAATMLSDLKWDPDREVPVFAKMLGGYQPARQRMAAVALGKYGPQASSAIPALRHAVETGEPGVRSAASNALAEVSPPADIKGRPVRDRPMAEEKP